MNEAFLMLDLSPMAASTEDMQLAAINPLSEGKGGGQRNHLVVAAVENERFVRQGANVSRAARHRDLGAQRRRVAQEATAVSRVTDCAGHEGEAALTASDGVQVGTVMPLLPGATIGMLGSGQLGRMFALAARRSGYRVHVYSPDADSPAGAVADFETVAAYDDTAALTAFARAVSVVTYEFENIPAPTVATLAKYVSVAPGENVLYTTQHRQREKEFLASHGFPVAPFRVVRSAAELIAAGEAIGYPSILKTAGFGYDGKGQERLNDAAALARAAAAFDGVPRVLEGFVEFSLEFSLVVARGAGGETRSYPPIENRHRNHILDLSLVPAAIPAAAAAEAGRVAAAIAAAIDLTGILCIEFFLTSSGALIVNELAVGYRLSLRSAKPD